MEDILRWVDAHQGLVLGCLVLENVVVVVIGLSVMMVRIADWLQSIPARASSIYTSSKTEPMVNVAVGHQVPETSLFGGHEPLRLAWPAAEHYELVEARRSDSCRICRKPIGQIRPDNSLILDYGREYAHQNCLSSGGLVDG